MFVKISPSISTQKMNVQKANTSFGMARLNSVGRQSADEFGYKNNEFINSNLYKKQGYFEKSALSVELSKGAKFSEICEKYGCTKNGLLNADFIRHQIISGKSNSSIKMLPLDERENGLVTLFEANYDNPELTLRESETLLNLIKDCINTTDYVKYSGIFKVGSER